jgi:phospholipid/cholesterol/gamma-HCH transport system substrate-binding protein
VPSRERVNWAKFRATAIVIVALSILAVLVYLLSGGTIFEEKATIYLYIPDATGVGPNSPVRVNGIGVGKVVSVSLSGSTQPQRVVRVVMSIEKKNLAKIPADSYAQLNTETLIGDKYVDVTSGIRPDSLQPNSEMTYREDASMMKSLDLQQFEQSLRDVDAILDEIEAGRGNVGELVMRDDLYRSLVKDVAEIQRTVQRAATTTGAIGEDLYTDKLYRQIAEPIRKLDESLAAIQSGQGTMGQFLRDSAQYDNLVATAQNLRKSVADIRAGDWIQSDQLYTGLSKTLTDLARSVDEFNAGPQFGAGTLYDNLNGMAKELETTVRDFREHPQKHLRLKVF